MPKVPLDRIDRRILEQLQTDCRLTNQDLAARVALSPSPCLRRVRALEKAGVIRQYVALVDPLQVGLEMLAYVTVKLEKKGRMPVEQFTRAVQSWPEVVACYSMTGDMDYLMRVQVEDLDHLIGKNIEFLHDTAVQGQTALVVQVALGDRSTVDLGPHHRT